MVRSIASLIRHAPDRFRHAGRRARARSVLRERTQGRVLFVCHGNICRSPYAEHALRRELGREGVENWTVESAGFVKPDRPSPVEARRVAARRGVDLEEHRSRLLTSESVGSADLIYVMSAAQERDLLARFAVASEVVWVLGDLDPDPISKRTIRDPVEQPESVFERVYDRIDRCLRVIVEATRPAKP